MGIGSICLPSLHCCVNVKDHAVRLFGAGVAIFERVGRKREVGLKRLHGVVSGQLHATLPPEILARRPKTPAQAEVKSGCALAAE